ncbi:MAG: anaerobic sulfite reductase subunit AsrB [Spirochaetes bacterium]|nr:anaerobic sulfite reductase subunit AsrB [Spirochaetota bacterium]
MADNQYLPFKSQIKDIVRHNDLEFTFKMSFKGKVLPGQFFEVSIPQVGEAPISVSGIDEKAETVDLTIRRVGKVTAELFQHKNNDVFFLRGPYGNGFKVDDYKNSELVIIAGGTGVSPVRSVIEYFSQNLQELKSFTLIAGFKSPKDILFRADFERWQKNFNVTLTTDNNGGDTQYKQGLVTEYIPALQVKDSKTAKAITVGPPAMMRFSIEALLKYGFVEQNIWLSHERRMCCGIGKCGHCRINDVYVCIDGPVFNYAQTKHLTD